MINLNFLFEDCQGTMSFNENKEISKEEWMARLDEGSRIHRMQMNSLIMNYLVTGNYYKINHFSFL